MRHPHILQLCRMHTFCKCSYTCCLIAYAGFPRFFESHLTIIPLLPQILSSIPQNQRSLPSNRKSEIFFPGFLGQVFLGLNGRCEVSMRRWRDEDRSWHGPRNGRQLESATRNWRHQETETERDSSYSQCKSECIHNSTIITMHSITEWQFKTLSHILVSHLISIHMQYISAIILGSCYSQHTYMLCALS